MNKIFLFSIGMVAILTVSTMNFSIQTSMAFPQNSNQNMMMGQWPMMKQMNQTGMGPMMVGQGMMMPCIMMGPMMMGNQTMMAMMPCMMGMGPMMNQTGMMGPMMMGPMMGMGPMMNQTGMMSPMMNQTGMMGMQ
jgi:hypothetical protein